VFRNTWVVGGVKIIRKDEITNKIMLPQVNG
jgi:hypothetical protein